MDQPRKCPGCRVVTEPAALPFVVVHVCPLCHLVLCRPHQAEAVARAIRAMGGVASLASLVHVQQRAA